MKAGIILLGLFGLFALAFNGVIYWGIAVAALSCILLGAGLFISAQIKWLIPLAVLIIGGCLYDAFAYYSSAHVSGNYYGGWIWSVPTMLCTILIVKNIKLHTH